MLSEKIAKLLREFRLLAQTREFLDGAEALQNGDRSLRERDVFIREIGRLKAENLAVYLVESHPGGPDFNIHGVDVWRACPFGPKAVIAALAALLSVGVYMHQLDAVVAVLAAEGHGVGFKTLNEHEISFCPMIVTKLVNN